MGLNMSVFIDEFLSFSVGTWQDKKLILIGKYEPKRGDFAYKLGQLCNHLLSEMAHARRSAGEPIKAVAFNTLQPSSNVRALSEKNMKRTTEKLTHIVVSSESAAFSVTVVPDSLKPALAFAQKIGEPTDPLSLGAIQVGIQAGFGDPPAEDPDYGQVLALSRRGIIKYESLIDDIETKLSIVMTKAATGKQIKPEDIEGLIALCSFSMLSPISEEKRRLLNTFHKHLLALYDRLDRKQARETSSSYAIRRDKEALEDRLHQLERTLRNRYSYDDEA